MVRAFLSKRKLFRVLLEEAPPAVRVQGLLHNRSYFVTALREAIRQRPPEQRRLDPENAAFVIVHSVIGTLHGAVLGNWPGISPEGLTRELSLMLQRYVE
jgi:hypothetical protein